MITCIIIGKVHIFEKQNRPQVQTKAALRLCFMVSWVLIGRKDTFQFEYWGLPKDQSNYSKQRGTVSKSSGK